MIEPKTYEWARTFGAAARNSSPEISWSPLLEYDSESVITDGFAGSRVTSSLIPRLVWLTIIVFDACPSGSADENAHSSSSFAGVEGTTAGVAGFGLAKSNIDGCELCGVDCLTGDASEAKGSTTGACCFANIAACCC